MFLSLAVRPFECVRFDEIDMYMAQNRYCNEIL